MDRSYRHPSKWSIQVTDLQETQKGVAPIKYQSEADDEGYFVIPGLTLGHHYQLIAHAQDGSRALSGSTVARPPMSNLSIFVSEDTTSPNTPPPPEPTLPGRGRSQNSGPSANLDPPTRTKGDDGETGKTTPRERAPSTGTGVSMPAPQPDPTNIVEGFQHRSPDPTVTVPNPAPQPQLQVPPPPPAWTPVTPQLPPAVPAPPPAPSGVAPTAVHIPQIAPRVPSCSLQGAKLYTFTLRDTRGNVYDYEHHHTGKLVLLDFFFTACMPCQRAIPELKQMHNDLGPHGLEIIGIACEQGGSPSDQLLAVRNFAARMGIPYRVLMSDRGSACPVRSQFAVEGYPTLFLIDDTGRIIWACKGPSSDQLGELRSLIRRNLNLPQ
jgi:thiol-disulfide isomerase/thioredoxin